MTEFKNNRESMLPPKDVQKVFISEIQRTNQYFTSEEPVPHPVGISPVLLDDYRYMCQEMIGSQDVLPDHCLAQITKFIEQDSHLQEHYPAGYKCSLAVFPFSNIGHPISPEEIKNGDHLRVIIVSPSGETINGLSLNRCYVSDYLPKEIQFNSFVIPEYQDKKEGNYFLPEERLILIKNITALFKNLQILLAL